MTKQHKEIYDTSPWDETPPQRLSLLLSYLRHADRSVEKGRVYAAHRAYSLGADLEKYAMTDDMPYRIRQGVHAEIGSPVASDAVRDVRLALRRLRDRESIT